MKISITLANYNHGRYLDTYFGGILRQTYADWELIVTDDGSTDNSREIIRRYAARDARIKVFEFPENRGSLPAFYNSYGHTTGELVYATASDDYLLDPTFLAQAAAAFAEHPSLGVFFGVEEIRNSETGQTHRHDGRAPNHGYIPPERCIRAFLANELIVQSCAAVVRKACIDDLGGFPSELGASCDYYLNHAVAARYGAYYCREVFACARVDPRRGNLSMQMSLRQLLHNLSEIVRRLDANQALAAVPRAEIAAWLKVGVRGSISIVYDCVDLFRKLRDLQTHSQKLPHLSPALRTTYLQIVDAIAVAEQAIAAEAYEEIAIFDAQIRAVLPGYRTELEDSSYGALLRFIDLRPDLRIRIATSLSLHEDAIRRYPTIIVYGMGSHTTILLDEWRARGLPPVTAITSTDAFGGGTHNGIPVVPLETADRADTLLILSSLSYEGVMFQAVQRRAPQAHILSFWDPRLSNL